MALDPSAWRGRRVFITGHTGFKGGWLSLWLSSLGAHVTGYALAPNTEPNFFTLAKLSADTGSTIDGIQNDIRDYPRLLNAVQQVQPEVIFHLAAQPLVRRSYANPRETYETNVMGTVNLLEAARHTSSVRAVVVVTSDKCYENHETHTGYVEDDPMGGHDPYSNSKGCAELVTSAFRKSYFSSGASETFGGSIHTLIASARAGNVIGGGDFSEDRLVPDLLRAFSQNKPALIRHPHAVRPWQHVLEPLCGYIMLAERLLKAERSYAGAWNFGPADIDSVSVGQMADTLCSQWGQQASWLSQQDGGGGGGGGGDSNQPLHEAKLLKLNSAKARTQLAWQAILPPEAALVLIVDWHNAHLRGDDMRAFSLQQITDYTAAIAS